MTVPVRLLFVAVLAFTAMAVFADSALMQRARVEPGCSVVRPGRSPVLEACHTGWFKGYPDLLSKGCKSVGVTTKLQYWSCPQPV